MIEAGKGHVIKAKFMKYDDDTEVEEEEVEELVIAISSFNEHGSATVIRPTGSIVWVGKDNIIETRSYDPTEDLSGLSELQQKLLAGIINNNVPDDVKCQIIRKSVEEHDDREMLWDMRAKDLREVFGDTLDEFKMILDL